MAPCRRPITFELNLTVNANGTVDEPALAGPESVLATPLACVSPRP